MAEILAEAAILDGALDELRKPEQTNTLWSGCERLPKWRIAARPTQVVNTFQHVPIKMGWFLVELGSRCPKSTNLPHERHGWLT